ncbi:glycosyltransferase involved in cell wall biosynthesis [Pseudomonas nitritireducens]|uniref:Glycosyltransferase involved in cell wall biosynthesis n=1 Tax=Pseudomonas nitroreducens TaxID=46680 RepID=A0A7W7KHI4_PSENT|nr:glycosyltransferase [Pseudomonas nitritireducens]MBB4862173.1 glycosyltransferase involved in cell wall biosynthesis [Pseudomonas nitritireducens]
MIGVLVPAHNEAQLLGACLASLRQAALHPGLDAEPVCILVVLDACTDDSEAVANACGVAVLRVEQRNVGHARRAGAARLLEQGARWLACTDADSSVDHDWLVRQLAFGAEAVCGTVRVADWSPRSEQVRLRHAEHYQAGEGHRHIHGANLGVCAQAYRRVGGFRPLPVDEDVHLVRDLERSGAHIVWTHQTCVTTSARRDCRARHGFGEFLDQLAAP